MMVSQENHQQLVQEPGKVTASQSMESVHTVAEEEVSASCAFLPSVVSGRWSRRVRIVSGSMSARTCDSGTIKSAALGLTTTRKHWAVVLTVINVKCKQSRCGVFFSACRL